MKTKTCSACKKNAKNTSVYGKYDAMKDANENSRLVEMMNNTTTVECDK